MRCLFLLVSFFWTMAVQAFEPSNVQVLALEDAVQKFQTNLEMGRSEQIYDRSDVSFQAAVPKYQFLTTWMNHRSDFGAPRQWNISEIFWYDRDAQGVFAVSEMQFLTDRDYIGCGYLVFKDNGSLGFKFLRADTLFIPTILRNENDETLYGHIQKAPGCENALGVFK